MHSRFGTRGVLLGGLLALAMAAFAPSVASAKPEPGVKRSGFRLFARSLGAMTINRVYCGISTSGEICVDSTNSSTIGGGYWPKGTGDQYVFNTGLQLAGIIGGEKPSNPWGGDTTGAFFFNARGDNVHGQEVQPIYNATNPDDVASWPDAARVPSGDASQDLFFPVLQGRVSASQGDIWLMSWEGDPSTGGGRPHPMGIVVETRGMGWNYPTGNQDIVYFIYTFYNVTSLNPADYASVRPSMRDILIQKAQQFHALNNAEYGVDLPDNGYVITDLYAAFGADMDVGSAGANYSTVELPFALGNTYQKDFAQPNTWTFDPGIFAPPFFPGVGFVGVKYLKSPKGPGEIQLFGNTINGGAFGDARNTTQLYRYLSGNISTAAGDAPCTTGDPRVTHICYVNNTSAADMRFFQSSTPDSLPPGQFRSIAVAYIFAAPVKVASFTPGGATDLKPGDPRTFSDVDALTTPGGVNMVDSLAGFLSFQDKNGDGAAQQDEYTVVPGSLLGKAQVAQQVFDAKFLLAFAPDAPEFYLVPGNNQVTVLWRPSPSDDATPGSQGDPYYQIASSPMITPDSGGAPVVNNLYDPNYRQFDVEGYRIYRGRVDAPTSLTLLAQFDYAGTSISDFSGFIGAGDGTGADNELTSCAPDMGVFFPCATAYDSAQFTPGVQRTISHEIPLVGNVIQVKSGSRALLADGTLTILAGQADTAVVGGNSGFPALKDTGVPFVYVDNGVRNNFRYFYAVTAFDVNSFASGPSSIESARITKAVTPRVPPSNLDVTADVSQSFYGRGEALTDNVLPKLDPATGRFNKPFPPADGWKLQLNGLVPALVKQVGDITFQLDSIKMGSAYDNVPGVYYITSRPGSPEEAHLAVSLLMDQVDGSDDFSYNFQAFGLDPASAANMGVPSDLSVGGIFSAHLPGAYYLSAFGRGCVNGADGFDGASGCDYNGARWFDGPSPANNESMANPNAGAARSSGDYATIPEDLPNYNNAGQLAGVTTIYEAKSYWTAQSTYRNVEGILGYAAGAADYNVYWGDAGAVDSVIDVTNNLAVPFRTDMNYSWGFLNASAASAGNSADGRASDLSLFDWGCVRPVKTYGTILACPSGTTYQLSQTAEVSPTVLVSGSSFTSATLRGKAAAGNGLSMYMPGHIFFFMTDAVPAKGTVWTLRSYTGAISGGRSGAPGNEGDYEYSAVQQRPFTAVGGQLRLNFNIPNVLNTPTIADLDRVHTVPDPYYITNEYEQSTDVKILKFVNLPNACTIRIYSSSGVLVDVIEHNSMDSDGTEVWNLQNRNHQVVASGVYFYHVESGDARRVGRFTVVNFAQ
jgi:hypothetical protein